MSSVNQAHQKLSFIGSIAILGGIGLIISLSLPYLQFSFLITISFSVFDLAGIVWICIGFSALLAVFAGLDLRKKANHGPTGILIASICSSGVAGIFIFREINNFNQSSISEFGFLIPLNYGVGLIIAICSVGLIIFSLILVSSNRSNIEILRGDFRSSHKGNTLPIQPNLPTDSSPSTPKSNKLFLNYCPNCGQENAIEKPFCIKCGAELKKG